MKKFFKSKTIQGALIGAICLILVSMFPYFFSLFKPFTSKTYFYATSQGHGYSSKNQLESASCWTNSLSSRRPDAYRCTVKNEIHDPCFIDPYNDSVLACPMNPNKALFFTISPSKLPRDNNKKFSNDSVPWFIKLYDGTECSFIGGATTLIAGMRVDYGCNDEKYEALLLPLIKKDELLKIKCYMGSKLEDCSIKEAWY